MPRLRVAVGGLEFRLHSQEAELLPPDDPSYQAFVSALDPPDGAESAEAIRVRLVPSPCPRFEGEPIFESSASWSVLARGAARGIVHEGDRVPLYAVHLEPRADEILVEYSSELLSGGARPALRCPFHYPLDQIVVMHLLGRRGFILHAACALVQGRGVALAGVSGAGKTTLAGLARGRAGWQPLSDDRGVVRVSSDTVAVLGTPWPGEGRIASADSGLLDWLLFLEKGESHDVEELTAGQALRRLLKTASIPWYDATAVGETLEACEQVLRRVRAAVLTFRPDAGAVESVERLVSERR